MTTVIEEDDSSPTTLEEVYELSYVPEGYVLKQENIYEEKATYIYINGRKDITFSQVTNVQLKLFNAYMAPYTS